jgi:hypothetical protein
MSEYKLKTNIPPLHHPLADIFPVLEEREKGKV